MPISRRSLQAPIALETVPGARTDGAPTVCLAMIVKDESKILARTLGIVRPHIDAYHIVDTGSTDATKAVIAEALRGVPGEVSDLEWQGFGHGKSAALERARKSGCTYAFILDADDELIAPAPLRNALVGRQAAYAFRLLRGESYFTSSRIFRQDLPWRYEGVLHEYPCTSPALPEPFTAVLEPTYQLHFHFDSARGTDPQKYQKDAALLERELAGTPEHGRYAFYCAQSYRDAGEHQLAYAWYRRRMVLGDWIEEVFLSALEGGKIAATLHYPDSVVLDLFARASEYFPARACEAMVAAARYCRWQGRFQLAEMYGERAVKAMTPAPENCCLHVDMSPYRWGAPEELGMAYANLGRVPEALHLWKEVLKVPTLPAHERARVEGNIKAHEARLASQGAA